MTTTVDHSVPNRRVCVWFGRHKIVDHVGEPAFAARFESAMRRRFAGLRVTNEPVVAPDADRR